MFSMYWKTAVFGIRYPNDNDDTKAAEEHFPIFGTQKVEELPDTTCACWLPLCEGRVGEEI